jgi:hypothetical protein
MQFTKWCLRTWLTAVAVAGDDAFRVDIGDELEPHPAAITATAVTANMSGARELRGRVIGEVISGPFLP